MVTCAALLTSLVRSGVRTRTRLLHRLFFFFFTILRKIFLLFLYILKFFLSIRFLSILLANIARSALCALTMKETGDKNVCDHAII